MRRFLCAVPLLVAGCSMASVTAPVLGTAYSDWYEVEPVMKPLPVVMEIARTEVQHAGFTLLPDDGTSRIYTEWIVQLSGHWREGFRTQLEVEVVPRQPRGFKVRVRGIREVNDAMRNSGKLDAAEWINASLADKQKPLIPEYAIRVSQILKLKLLEN